MMKQWMKQFIGTKQLHEMKCAKTIVPVQMLYPEVQ
jgi:hypothetical protein